MKIDKDWPAAEARKDRWDRLMAPFYWLAGCRWETLRHCPPTERERMAVIGSTVMIPTIMGFCGMFFYARHRFADPPLLGCVMAALVWSFVIMNTDRILVATYRSFQPLWRRGLQVVCRFVLASVVSVAIAFPFCLDQYRGAIVYRMQTELQTKLNNLRELEAAGSTGLKTALLKIREDEAVARKQIVADYKAEHDPLSAHLPDLEKAILIPEEYADARMEEERRRASEPEFVAPAGGATRNAMAQIEAQKETLAKTKAQLDELQDLHRRLIEAIAREKAGLPNEFYPQPKKRGDGPRTKEMEKRDKTVSADIDRLTAAATAQREAFLASDKQLAATRLADRNAYLDGLASRHAGFVEEAKERERLRKERLANVNARIAALETEHPRKLARLDEQTASLDATHQIAVTRHNERYLPHFKRLEDKMKGVLDPMEETVGLYRVIFLPALDADEVEKGEHGQKWIAGLLQFAVVFGTLFVIDLIPILAKMMSRPGAYDVLVEFAELVPRENFIAFRHEYPNYATRWMEEFWAPNGDSPKSSNSISVSDPGPGAEQLLACHLPGATNFPGAFRVRVDASRVEVHPFEDREATTPADVPADFASDPSEEATPQDEDATAPPPGTRPSENPV
jgi:hypothetical protein